MRIFTLREDQLIIYMKALETQKTQNEFLLKFPLQKEFAESLKKENRAIYILLDEIVNTVFYPE